MNLRTPSSLPDVIDALRDALAGGPPVLPAPSDAARAKALAAGPVSTGTALLVSTSGSTASPKLVELSAAALTASARGTSEVLGGPGHWLVCLPINYIAGVQVLVRSLLDDREPVVMDTGPFRPSSFVAAVRRMDTDRRYVSLVPTQLVRLLDDPVGTSALQSFSAVLVGGSATPAPLLQRARESGIAVRTTYGMSETAGGCFYDGVALPGASAAFDDDGRIALSGPMLASGYLGDGEAMSAAFVGGRFVTADVGHLDADGRLRVLGRIDDVIITGGHKVLPLEVSAAILTVPGVVDAYVTGIADPHWGRAVTAWVVTSTESDLSDAVRSAVRAQVGAVAVPRRIVRVDAIPQLDTGKPDRRRLLAELE